MSTSICVFCGGAVRSSERTCPRCGGTNSNYVPEKPRTVILPKTIGELKDYCEEKQIPLSRLRFFIGENYTQPKAFGIYQAGENRFVAYKNKADGSRSVRYDGPDEAFAVSEVFAKLLEECTNHGLLK